MKTKRIVITGGPSSGKTSLIKYLENEGYQVMHEISRDVILEAKKEGIDQLFLDNPILFSEKLLEGRLKQFHEGENCAAPILFYDRGMPDVTAYMDYLGTHYSENFNKACLQYKYDEIFVLPPWEEIYEQDNERYESFEQAEKIFHFLKNGYENYGYKVIEVPVGSIKERVDFILKKI
ncbi:putative ATPase [Aequorivita sublithincola DSM 14238]|uniref:Putative ATPase n=1 Tax=Aequorivita sublithincola (strain DSM 14238 / LMG 21431 / ACAM 643 / 9-3) TaxID=746697 RepID=I3YY04_AEQSU|nr:ATP-binding protein [Aequorivita sublithincola]AFL81872.1 putative ATPase [Aequorivita sublithincola DSM 14238]